MPIKNLSNVRRLPRLGRISLGVKKISEKSGKEYPVEVEHFVVPEKVAKIFGENPRELRIMFPVENEEIFFQQWYKRYTVNLLQCKGDGERAFTWDENSGGMKEIPCPCEMLEKRKCARIGILQFLLPEVEGAGVWQITTGSKNSIIDVNSGITYVRSICGRIRMIPLILRRIQIETQRIEDGKPKKTKHYTLQLDLQNISLRQLQQAAQVKPEMILLPPPDESKDELFYPPNGFKPEEEQSKEEKTAAAAEEDLSAMKANLAEKVALFKEAGGKLTQKQNDRICALKTKDEFELAIKFYQLETEKLSKRNN